MFQLLINKKIKKQILRFPVAIQEKIEQELFELVKLPHPIQHRPVKKLGGYATRYRLHIGRSNVAVFDVSKAEALVKVIEVNTRENVKY